jgi:hypothetical protein
VTYRREEERGGGKEGTGKSKFRRSGNGMEMRRWLDRRAESLRGS